MFNEHKLSYLATVSPQSHLSDTRVHTRDRRCPAIEQTVVSTPRHTCRCLMTSCSHTIAMWPPL